MIYMMNRGLKALIMSAALTLLSVSCGHGFRTLGNEEFMDLLMTDTSVVLLDVRTPEEYAASHIPGAVNLDVQSPDFLLRAEKDIDRDTPVAVYCRSGVRSRNAAKILSGAGYTVYNLKTGILGWDGPVYTPEQEESIESIRN